MMPVITLDHTFSALADSVTNFDNDEPLPDFWSKKRDPEQNRVTPSGIWWEWQDPSMNVVDVIRRKNEYGENESLGIESVVKEGEYVVVLLKENEMERGMPIGTFFSLSTSTQSLLLSIGGEPDRFPLQLLVHFMWD
jgi:hypothetical protein